MRRRFGQQLRIGVSARAVALVATSRFQREELSVLAERRCADGAIDTICASVRDLLADASCAGWPVSLVVADELARLWQVTPAPGSTRVADLEGAAALRFQTLYGEAPLLWRIAADYDPARPFMAAAMPRQLLALLEQACAGRQLKVVEIVPQFVAGLNRWRGALKPGAWYGQVQEQVLTLCAGTAVRAVALPRADVGAAGNDWLRLQLEREALRLNLPAPERLMVSGDAPAAWRHGAACTVLGPERDWSAAVRLAATGSVA